ncbi:family 2B encapsulin nanocompartment shell protein [Nostoc sp. 'Peltigera membranacea cyanobiont' 232]|uniref:family 2B encapsulin nanocompartment shell protein n=1 Tax=Nostoc sp. 'Peltigera membranacea cyanobiont' 232 TaxID=2014531 RepID=UPI000B95B12F|nr:family 2B encapsulin nanocompartment shell protein [Nostoc sp. 'Peltigera membranacea cyanobiont' 232]OYE02991.1 Crp/Fnr family transcriptional regulator [Nostoc sp. 'Peltigera membranacea cyanobiont' 232]
MTDSIESNLDVENEHSRLSLSTAAARNLSTTTKSAPQMQGITSRWLLKMLPWVQTKGGTYRVNRRLTYTVGDGRLSFSNTGAEVQVIPQELGELPLLRGFDNVEVLNALAGRFVQQEFAPGNIIVQSGQAANQLFLIAHGKVNKISVGKYGEQPVLGVLADGDYFGGQVLLESQSSWQFTIQALTRTTVLALPQQAFRDLLNQSEALQAHVDRFRTRPQAPQNKYGEASIEVKSGHLGETELPGTFVDYELSPREYELSVAQTVLRVSTRVADLYNQPMNQTEQQLRLTIEALRERQEHELINNRQFGLLHNADLKQRIYTRTGPPTPDDLDELLTRRRKSKFFLAHPRTIAAFGRECNRLGIYSENIDLDGSMVSAWRGVPILPCNKIPISNTQTSSILVLRTGEEDQGVIGLHQTGIPDEYQPSLSVRFMGISEKAIISYLVTAYYSAAVLVPDALGILEDVEIGR